MAKAIIGALWGVLSVFWACAALAGPPRVLGVETGALSGPGVTVAAGADLAYRAFVMTGPPRLVLDFASPEVAQTAPPLSAPVAAYRAGRLAGGWSRMILELDAPHIIAKVGPAGDDRLRVQLSRTGAEAMARAAELAPGPDVLRAPRPDLPPPTSDRLRIVLDPGHGGVDPGAMRDGVSEKDIVLSFAREFAVQLEATGRYDVMLTRDGDDFVLLQDRVERARGAEAALFISLHVNTVTEGAATGATLYVASDTASDAQAAAFARWENGRDHLSGVPARALPGDIALTLLDLERGPTTARSRMAAEQMVAALGKTTGTVRSRPLRKADFTVLRAPDMVSVLLELGFLSHPVDRANMTSPEWRAQVGEALIGALDAWIAADQNFLALMGQ